MRRGAGNPIQLVDQHRVAAAESMALKVEKEADKLEKNIQQWQAELVQVDALLSDNDIYQAEHKNELTKLLKQQANLKNQIEENEMLWLELAEQIEEILTPPQNS